MFYTKIVGFKKICLLSDLGWRRQGQNKVTYYILHNLFKMQLCFFLHQLIRLISLCIKELRYSYQKMNSL